MKQILSTTFIALLVFNTPLFAQVQEQEMETDRPDFTEGTQAVSLGRAQVEAGYTFSSQREGGRSLETHSLPEFLLRVGLVEGSELRIAWEGYVFEDTTAGYGKGTTDFSLGLKQEFLKSAQGDPLDLSAIFELGLPVGSEQNSADQVEPGVKLLWALEISEMLPLAGNTNLSYLAGEEDDYFELANSIAYGRDLTNSIGAYLEYFHFVPLASGPERTEHYLNGGFTFSYTPDLQFDMRVGFGMNEAADDFFSGVGVSYRL